MKPLILLTIGLFFITNSYSQAYFDQVENNNRFAFDLYQYVNVAKENLFISPFSVSAAMAMVYEGSAGTTKDQIAEYLHFSSDKLQNLKHFEDIISRIQNNQEDNKFIMNIANSVWAQYDFNILQTYLDAIQNYFNAPVEKLDFKDPVNREKVRIQINEWTTGKTNQRIKDVLDKKTLDDSTKLVVVNAVYFKAGWQLEFKKSDTKKNFFYGIDQTYEKEFMYVESQLKYAKDKGVSLLEIPYIDHKASMIILLPNDPDKFLDLQNNFDNEYLNELYNKSKLQTVNLWLPKYKIDYKVDLKNAFFKAGMILPFLTAANFSDMVAQNNIRISSIIHQTYITVDESGTEAAAATALIGFGNSCQKTVEFNANRPFIFLIKDNATGSILFLGQLLK